MKLTNLILIGVTVISLGLTINQYAKCNELNRELSEYKVQMDSCNSNVNEMKLQIDLHRKETEACIRESVILNAQLNNLLGRNK